MKYTIEKLFLAIAFMFSSMSYGQTTEPKIAFENLIHDFGKLKENGGKAVAEFHFKNIGTKPLLLQNVQASCGCTVPEYTTKPILPNEKGVIKATFDPSGRPGVIDKTITVTSNDPQKVTILRLKGEVSMKEPSIEDQFPFVWTDLRLNQITVSMGIVEPTKIKTSKIEIYNTNATTPLNLEFSGIENYITVKANPKTLAPNSRGEIIVTFDASKRNDWDYVTDWFYVTINGKKMDEQRLMVSARIMEDFSGLTPEQISKAPVASFSEEVFDFGEIKEGNKVNHTFVVTNTGKTPLIIRKVVSSCGCTAASPSKKVINPGDKAEIETVFDSKGRPGKVYKTITIVTNAPANASKTLTVTGNVGE